MTAGQVDIGAFRTFPADYHAEGRSTQQAVLPSHKTEEYGAHADRYYSLAVELFTTSAMRPLFHLLWNEYWAHTLCTSPSLLQRTLSIHHTNDLVNQLREATAQLGGGGLVPGGASFTQAARAASRSHDAEPAQDLANELERRAAEQPLARIADEAYVVMLTQQPASIAGAPRSATRIAQDGSIRAYLGLLDDYQNRYKCTGQQV